MSVNKHMNSALRGKAKNENKNASNVSDISEIDLGLLQMQILWMLSRKSTHGYDLMKNLNDLKKTTITQGTLYPTLQRLVDLDLITRDEQGRKIVYHITPRGREAMNNACVEFSRTFFGIFHDFVCGRCDHGELRKKGKLE